MGESLVQSLGLEGCHVEWWTSGAAALLGVRTTQPDLVICDIRLPDLTGEEVFRRVAATGASPPFLFVTAYGDIDQAVTLIRSGAGDYITKPFDMRQFIDRAHDLIQRHPIAHTEPVLGVSRAMLEIEQCIRRVADLASPVLFTGETGVGKEVCARYLHRVSRRSREPFMAVDCAAIPRDVLKSELFGHERGALANTIASHRGFAERAKSGLLFFDEIGLMPSALQASLLRLVESNEFHRIGGEQRVPFKARVVCASNMDLDDEVRAGRFRKDLLYRINTVRIDVPPLRHRGDDIPWLMERFFKLFQPDGKAALRGFSTLAKDAAMEHSWPGNVRELKNRVERAVALCRGEWILPADLFPELQPMQAEASPAPSTLAEVREAAERRQIARVLRQTQGHLIKAAKLLGVSRTTLWEKMRRLGLSGWDRPA